MTPPITTLIELADDGQSFAEIGEPFGLSGAEVGRLLKQANYSRPCEDWELLDVTEMMNRKMSLREIGQRIDRHPTTLSNALKKAGVEVKRHKYNSHKPLPPDADLLALYDDMPIAAIEKEIKINISLIHQRLKQLGVDMNKHYGNQSVPAAKLPSKATLRKLLSERATYEEIAQMYVVSFDAVYKKAKILPSYPRTIQNLLKHHTPADLAEKFGVSVDEVIAKANL